MKLRVNVFYSLWKNMQDVISQHFMQLLKNGFLWTIDTLRQDFKIVGFGEGSKPMNFAMMCWGALSAKFFGNSSQVMIRLIMNSYNVWWTIGSLNFFCQSHHGFFSFRLENKSQFVKCERSELLIHFSISKFFLCVQHFK